VVTTAYSDWQPPEPEPAVDIDVEISVEVLDADGEVVRRWPVTRWWLRFRHWIRTGGER
jgi:hypothetical protein